MTKKIVDIAVISVGMVFLCWYLPVAFYNVYACDDYWFGTNVRVNGFWGNQLFYYYNWEGSYTHTFLASLPHAFHSSCMPFLGNLFSLVLLFISVFCVFRTYTSLSVKRGLAYSLFFFVLFVSMHKRKCRNSFLDMCKYHLYIRNVLPAFISFTIS